MSQLVSTRNHREAKFGRLSTCRDYQGAGILNEYDEEMLDERDYGNMDVDARMGAEREIAQRERRERRRTGLEIAGESEDGKYLERFR